MAGISAASVGISPGFSVSAEDLRINNWPGITLIKIDGVRPPVLGPDNGFSFSMRLVNKWFPWIDEKLVEPKYDGVCQYLGVPSNKPSFIKDYHFIALNRAVETILYPEYHAMIVAKVGSIIPQQAPSATQ